MKEFAKKLPMISKARELILDMDDSMPRWKALLGDLDLLLSMLFNASVKLFFKRLP